MINFVDFYKLIGLNKDDPSIEFLVKAEGTAFKEFNEMSSIITCITNKEQGYELSLRDGILDTVFLYS